jgi:Holliday junction resolvasome RuvABC ATP-dependent DNA helicase subunit
MARRWLAKRLADVPAGERRCPDCGTALADGFCSCGYIPDEDECKEDLASEMRMDDRAFPPGLDDVIGNSSAVAQIRTLLGAYRARLAKIEKDAKASGQVARKLFFPHLLLSGLGGTEDKRMLGEVVAREIKGRFCLHLGQWLQSPAHVHDMLQTVETGDVLFIDEIHLLECNCQETLCEDMEQGIPAPINKAGQPVGKPTRLPPFTLIGSAVAFARPLGDVLNADGFRVLSPSLRHLIGHSLIVVHRVTTPELAEAIAQRAAGRGLTLDAEAAALIAERAQGSGQLARRVLDWSMDAAKAQGVDMVDVANVRTTFELMDIDYLGRDAKGPGGYVYALLNATMPGLVKIGKTEREPDERAKELSCGTGVATPFVVAYAEAFIDCSEAEGFVHALLEREGFRVAQNREFFCAPVKAVIQAIMKAKEREDQRGSPPA